MTPLGALIAAAGLLALLAPRRWLYGLFIFSIPFSGTSVFNVGSGNDASGVQIWMYFGALVLLRDLFIWLYNPDAGLKLSLVRRGLLLMAFILVLTASLIMPVYIAGRLSIESPILTDFSSAPLSLSAHNVTALVYIVFGSVLAMSIARRNIQDDEARFTEKTYLAAGLLCCILGVSEFAAHLVNIPSPTVLFRNSASPSAGSYLGLLEGGVSRVSSVAVEPSILAQYLCTVFPLTIPALLGKGHIYSKTFDRCAFCLLLLTSLLTTSSVAYVMLIIAPILCIPVISKLGISTMKVALYGVLSVSTFVAGGGALYVVSPAGRQILNAALLAKSASYSSLERLKTVSLAWKYFEAYPVLGVGWGSVTSHDLVFMILANSGIIGLTAFILIVFRIAFLILRFMKGVPDAVSLSRAIWLLSGVLLIASSVISEFPFVFGYFWMVAAMGIAASTRDYRSEIDKPVMNLNVEQRAMR